MRASFGVLLIWAFYSIQAQSGEGTLHVEIRDPVNGQIVPAMVCITSLADHSWRAPPDGRAQPPNSMVKDFYDPAPWKPGQMGPVRLTTGEFHNFNMRMPQYGALPAYPFWREPAAYFISQAFSITLPAGKWRLAVARGIEHLPVYEEFEITPNQKLERNISLARWVDMPKQGWYSGDTHVHYPRTKPEHDEFLMTWTRAEDIHISNILSFGDIDRTYMTQSAYGQRSHYRKDDYLLASGDEDPRAAIPEQGHVVNLNIQAPVRDTTRYHLYDVAFDSVHAQGGLTGYAHLAWAPEYHRRLHPELHPTWDASINTIRGKIDFFEILQFRHLGLEDYYDFLNLGIKLTATAGSDVPWGASIGEVRTYAYTGPEFSAETWFDAVKRGRTFVTNGPMLEFSVQDRKPGDELRVEKNANLRIRARAWAPAAIGAPMTLQVVSHGRVIRKVTSSDSAQGELRAQFDLRVNESQWIALRVTSFNGAVAHSSPVYVTIDGKSFADRTQRPALIENRLEVLHFIRERLRDPKFLSDYTSAEVKGLTARIDDAMSRYKVALE